MADLKKIAHDAIDAATSDLYKLSEDIWNHPELALKETRAHETITDFLTQQGFEVSLRIHYGNCHCLRRKFWLWRVSSQ